MKKSIRTDEILLILLCGGILAALCTTVCLRLVVGEILGRMGINNPITRLILSKDENTDWTQTAAENGSLNSETDKIDWMELYPFSEEASAAVPQSTGGLAEAGKKADKIFYALKSKAGKYTSENLVGYRAATESAAGYEELIGWNIVPFSEYNGVVRLKGNYFYTAASSTDTARLAKALIQLEEFCSEHNTNFLYVQAPSKISPYEDMQVSGNTDFSNQNADALLGQLKAEQIPYMDLRNSIRDQGLSHHGLFYETDHHWKAETGLWAAKNIFEYLKNADICSVDFQILNSNNFIFDVYEDWFLGSQGKKMTLSRAEPEDFTMIYPDFETSLEYMIPDIGLHITGDFSITYDFSRVKVRDYYNGDPYAAYNHGNRPLVIIKNLTQNLDSKILVIHDSYANSVIPFMALGCGEVHALDLRYFNGSVRCYIEKEKPDIVIVSYNAANIYLETNLDGHNYEWDFR